MDCIIININQAQLQKLFDEIIEINNNKKSIRQFLFVGIPNINTMIACNCYEIFTLKFDQMSMS